MGWPAPPAMPEAARAAAHLAQVVSVQDPDRLGRVQVRLLGFDGVGEQDGPLWARVAVPFAGAARGAFLLPDVGDEVLVVLVNGDPRWPLVVGGLWNGAARPPEQLPGSAVDRWTLVGKAGSRIAIVEEAPGRETISLTTPGGVTAELTAQGGGRIRLEIPGTSVTLEPAGVSVRTGGQVQVQASQVTVTAGAVTVDAAVATFSGVVQCQVLQATTVISSVYTPGAGNIW
jgi:uncharacterized protein involved in type VI secretion and phage assembly